MLMLGLCGVIAGGSLLGSPTALPEATAEPTLAPAAVVIVTLTPEAGPPSITPTATVEPTVTHAPTPSATLPPPFTPRPPPARTATPSCAVLIGGAFARLWTQHQADLGCALSAEPAFIQDAEQAFQNGHMFWRADLDVFYVVYDAGGAAQGNWSLFPGKYNEGGLAACPEAAPPGLVKPIRGFGNVWCGLGGASAAIGWGLDAEFGYTGAQGVRAQDFERGVIFQDSDGVQRGLAYVLVNSGRFVRAAP